MELLAASLAWCCVVQQTEDRPGPVVASHLTPDSLAISLYCQAEGGREENNYQRRFISISAPLNSHYTSSAQLLVAK